MKIKLYSVGGINYLPTSGSAAGQSPAASSTGDSESSKVPGFTKEIIDLVKESGLDSDVTQFLDRLEKTLHLAADPTGEHLSMRDILKVTKEANKVKRNMELYNDAKSVVDKQESWGEVATTDKGYLYVWDKTKNKMDTISPTDYNKNRDDYTLMTNSDILFYRANNSAVAFNQSILNDVSQSIGTGTIAKYVQDLVSKLGKSTLEGYTQKQQGQIQRGLEKLLQYGPDGVYSIKSTTPMQDQDIDFVLRTLRDALPKQYKNALEAKAVAEGLNPGDGYRLLGEIAVADAVRETTTKYDKTASLAAGHSTGSADDPKLQEKDTLPIRVAKGDLKQTTAYLSPRASRVSDKAFMAFQAWNAGPLVDDNGHELGAQTVKQTLQNCYQLLAGDTSTVFFGNQLLKGNEVEKLVYNGDSLLTRVAIPMKFENGKQVPDFDLVQQLNKANAWISDHPNMTPMEIREQYSVLASQPGIKYDPEQQTFTIDPSRIGYFLTFAAYASEDLMDLKQSENYLEKVDRAYGKGLKGTFNNLVRFGKSTSSKKDRSINGVGISEANDFYLGNVYIPITDAIQAFEMTKNQYYTRDTFTNVAQKEELNRTVQAVNQNDSNFIRNF